MLSFNANANIPVWLCVYESVYGLSGRPISHIKQYWPYLHIALPFSLAVRRLTLLSHNDYAVTSVYTTHTLWCCMCFVVAKHYNSFTCCCFYSFLPFWIMPCAQPTRYYRPHKTIHENNNNNHNEYMEKSGFLLPGTWNSCDSMCVRRLAKFIVFVCAAITSHLE